MSTSSSYSAPMPASSIALGFIVVCLAVYILQAASTIMIPFVMALFMWYLINALARFIGRVGKLPRFFSFLFAIITLIGGMWFIYKLIGANAVQVMQAAPDYQQKFENFLPTVLEKIPAEFRPNKTEMIGYLNLGAFITALVKTFTGIAGQALVVMFYTGFMLYEQRFFGRKLREMIDSRKTEARVEKTLHNIDLQIQRYIGVKTFVSALTGLLTWLWVSLFHVDFAQFWGVMAFVLNFIPYVGSLVAILLPTFISLVQFGDLTTVFLVGAGLCMVQMSCGSILEPRMMGDNLNLSPICIIFSVASWGVMWGVPGMILSIPILAMIAITLAQFPRTRPIAILLSKTGDIDPADEAVAKKD